MTKPQIDLADLLVTEAREIKNVKFLVGKSKNFTSEEVKAAAARVIKKMHDDGIQHRPPVV